MFFQCTKCNHIEADVDKLKKRFKLGAAIVLCCSICCGFHEVVVVVRPKSEADPFTSTPASPPLESSAATAINASVAKRCNPPFVKAEEAVDEDMSAGAEAADIPISAPSSPRILSQGIAVSKMSEEVLAEAGQRDEEHAESQSPESSLMTDKFYGDFKKLRVAELRNQLNFNGIETDDSQGRWSLIGKLSKAVTLGGTKITAAASTVKVTCSTFDALPL